MRQQLLSEGASELSYEIREVVKKATLIKNLGQEIYWENIGDPIQKHHILPDWIKNIVADLVQQNDVYSYCPSKGVLETREFLAAQTKRIGRCADHSG
jgi:alanine-synthesizing transaminase